MHGVSVLVLGAGGVGGYFGGRLAEAGVDVTFLVRPKRREQLLDGGLRIESPRGNVRMPVRTVLASELQPGCDFILLACKAYDLEAAMDAMTPAVQGNCAIVPLLNGVRHFELLDRRFGRSRVMGGTCQIYSGLGPNGEIVHTGPLQRLIFGERDRLRSARAGIFAEQLGRTRIDWRLSDDIEQDVWEKVMLLSALAAASCLFRGPVRDIVAAPGGREAMERALAANVEILRREGHPPRPDVLEFARHAMTNPASVGTPSMLRDIEAGHPVEADHIVGWMLERARSHGVDAPVLSLAYTHLKAYEARRAAGRLPDRRSEA